MHQPQIKYKDIKTNQLIADLKWAVQSPALLIEPPPQTKWKLWDSNSFNTCKNWMAGIEKNPSTLKAFFNLEQQFILGKYFEKLIHFVFLNHDKFSIIAQGLQIIKNKRTIGEIDFLINEKNLNQNTHLEVAVKYYMGFGNSAKHAMWIGPNGMDSLEGKILKFSNQLSIGLKEKQLSEFRPESFKRSVLLKGYFFKHVKSVSAPYFSNPNANFGLWLYQNELRKIIDEKFNYSIVPKRLWLSFYFDEQLEIMDGKSVIEAVIVELNRIGKGILLAEITDKPYKVKKIYMIAPNDWPNLTK